MAPPPARATRSISKSKEPDNFYPVARRGPPKQDEALREATTETDTYTEIDPPESSRKSSRQAVNKDT
jgi:hypothetical protein